MAAVGDTGTVPGVVSEDLLPPGWRAHAWRAPTRIRIVDASGQALKALAGLPLTLHVHDKPVHLPYIVVTRLSVLIIIGCDVQRQRTKAILPQHGKIESSTSVLEDTLGYHLGATGRQFKVLNKPRVRPKESNLADANVLPPGAQTEVQVVTRSTGRCLIRGWEEFSEKHGLHLSHRHHKKVHRPRPFSVLPVNLGRKTNTFAKGTRVGVAEPHTGKARHLFQRRLLAVQKQLAALRELDTQMTVAEAESPPEPPVVPPTKEPETPEVNWEGVRKELHGKVHALVHQFRGMWSENLGELKATTLHIQLKPDAKPVYAAPYRAGAHRRLEIEKQVKKVLDLGVIEPSAAEWSVPVVVVPKPGGQIRFCVDYRRLNERAVKDVYPIPRMDDCLESLGDATVFSTLGCNAGYWQIRVAAEDRDKTMFTSHTGLFRYLRLPSGLVNAPASFQRALDIILSGLLWKTGPVYLDDVLVFSRSVEDHIWNLREVLLILEKAGVTQTPSKCLLFQQEVEYLGHSVRPGQLLLNRTNIKILARTLPPRKQTEL